MQRLLEAREMKEMISKRDILEISCKVLGLICLIRGIVYLSPVAFMNLSSFAYLVGPFVFHLASAFILLKWSRNIASFMVREDQPVELKVEGDWQRPVYTLCLRVVGAVVCIKAVPTIIRAISEIILRSRIPNATPVTGWLSLIWAIVYLALGIYFIGGAKEVVRIALKGSLREQ
jgi:hypothetical protein